MAIPPDPEVAATVVGPLNVPLAPLAGAAKVTVTPLRGLLFESFTLACRNDAKAAPMFALCGVPPVALIERRAGAVLVRLNCPPDVPFGTVATTR